MRGIKFLNYVFNIIIYLKYLMDNFNNTIYFQRVKERLLHVKGVLSEVFWNPD